MASWLSVLVWWDLCSEETTTKVSAGTIVVVVIIFATEPDTRYFTFSSPCGNELVFFNAAQVLPCYVIKLHYGPYNKQQHPQQLPPLLQKYQEENDEEITDAKKKQEKLLARVC